MIRKLTASGIFIVAALFIFFSNNMDFNNNNNAIEKVVIPVSSCYPQNEICTVISEKFNLEVKFDKNIFYLKPFGVTITTEAINDKKIDAISVDFKMNNMNMGINRFNFLNKNKINNKDTWGAKAVLPVCVTARADWIAEISVLAKNKKYLFSFPLNVQKGSM